MNNIIYNTLAIAILFGFSSCSSYEIYPKDNSEELNREKFKSNKEMKDALFLVKAAEIYLEEINLAKHAQQNGTTSAIKELAKTMEQDNQISLIELTSLAKSKNVTIPSTITDQGDEAFKLLDEKAGDEFDETYANLMVEKHKVAIEIFERASKRSRDLQIQEWATIKLVVLRKGLAEAKICAEEYEREYLTRD